MDGIEATRQIATALETSGVRVLILTTFDLDEYVFAALRAGASGFLLKEREVLTLIGLGLSNTEIAARLHVSLCTAKTHVGRLLMKLSAGDRAQLVIAAYDAAWSAQPDQAATTSPPLPPTDAC